MSRAGQGGAARPPVRSVLISWDVAPEHVQAVRHAFPDLRVDHAPDSARAIEAASEADVMLADSLPPELLRAASRARWLHSVSAGVESWFHPELLEREILLTNSSGTHGPQIAEIILGMALCFATGLHTLIAAARTPTRGHLPSGGGWPWPKGDVRAQVLGQKFVLEGQTMGVVGLGAIGDATARKAHGLGMRVLATRRRPTDRPPYVERLLGADHADLLTVLAQSDHVALCLPLTPDTEGLLGEAELRAMKPSAYLYNVGRGGSVDQAALLAALREGQLAGAGLDVTVPDPPEDASPLWEMPNVILSQHTSGFSPHNDRLITELFIENLRRYRAGQPLRNQVDPHLGY